MIRRLCGISLLAVGAAMVNEAGAQQHGAANTVAASRSAVLLSHRTADARTRGESRRADLERARIRNRVALERVQRAMARNCSNSVFDRRDKDERKYCRELRKEEKRLIKQRRKIERARQKNGGDTFGDIIFGDERQRRDRTSERGDRPGVHRIPGTF